MSAGSSPRARGTDEPESPHALLGRFIPACAGNSRQPGLEAGRETVHPRVRGEQLYQAALARPGAGSSPRARGTD